MRIEPCPTIDACPRDARLRLHEAAANIAEFGAWECDLATSELTWTRGVYDIFDLPPDRSPQRNAIVDLYVDEWRRDMEHARSEVIRTGRSVSIDSCIRTARGHTKWIRLSIGVVHEGSRPVRLFGAKQDVTRYKQEIERLRHLAEHDSLTGLLNRGMFDAHYRDVTRDSGSVAALAVIDLDCFKEINDRFGHAAGDECLRQTATRLLRLFGHTASVFRIGGDEFAMLLRAPMGREAVANVLTRACRVLSKPLVWNGITVDMAVSIGAAMIGSSAGRTPSQLFAEADAALYQAKSFGRRRVRISGDVIERVDHAERGGLHRAG